MNETEKYTHGGYAYNEVMSRIANSTTIKQLVHYGEYFNKHQKKYSLVQVKFAAEFFDQKFKQMEAKYIGRTIEDLNND